MQLIKVVSAIVLFLALLAGAAYLGGWVLFIGGIVSIVEAFKATPVSGLGIAFGLLRVLVAAPTFWITVMLGGALTAAVWPSRRGGIRGR